MVRRRRVNFWATKPIKKPVTVKFKRSDGSVAKFRATKIVRKPVKVDFYAKKKRYKKW